MDSKQEQRVETDGSSQLTMEQFSFVDLTPDFGQIETMHSYRSELYVSLASQLFLTTYTEYFHIPIKSKITIYCDNKAYVERLTKFISDPYLTRSMFKKTEQEAYRIILQIKTPQF